MASHTASPSTDPFEQSVLAQVNPARHMVSSSTQEMSADQHPAGSSATSSLEPSLLTPTAPFDSQPLQEDSSLVDAHLRQARPTLQAGEAAIVGKAAAADNPHQV